MDALSPADLRRTLDAVYALGLVSSIDELPLAAVQLTWQLVPCDHVGWVAIDFGLGKMTGIHWPIDLSPLFGQLPSNLTTVPLVSEAAMAPTTAVVRLSDFVSRRELHNTAIYNDLYRGVGIEYQIVVPLGFGRPGATGFKTTRAESLTLARSDADFTDRDRAVLDEFGRHLRNAILRLRAVDRRPTAETAARLGLTARQGESLVAIADGATVRMASQTLGVTPKTLENHLQAAYARLGVSNRTAALARLRMAQGSGLGLGDIPVDGSHSMA
jgi:DNA-binding CsgD family transcriptional regulator